MIQILNTLLLSLLCITGTPASDIAGASNDQDTDTYTLIIFEGSDWCAACRKFEKRVLKDSTVVEFLEQGGLEVIKADFPQRKKQSKEQIKTNEQLAKKYGFKGIFPTVVLASTSQEAYHTLNAGATTPEVFIQWLKSNTQPEDD